jgi:hypothetical protein
VSRARLVRLLPLGACLAGVGYLALKPSPDALTIPLLPRSWALFLDLHDTFNNVSAFAILTAVGHWTLSGWHREPLAVLVKRAAWLQALVISLELAQLWIPRRTCDWHDMLSGLIGITIATIPWIGRPGSNRAAPSP